MSRFLWGIALASALAVTVYQTESQVDIAGRSVKTAYTRWAFNFWFNPHLFRLGSGAFGSASIPFLHPIHTTAHYPNGSDAANMFGIPNMTRANSLPTDRCEWCSTKALHGDPGVEGF